MMTLMHSGDMTSALEKIDGIQADIKEKKKELVIADMHGWQTVRDYRKDPLADNEEDERRLRSAIARNRQSSQRGRASRFQPYSRPSFTPQVKSSLFPSASVHGPVRARHTYNSCLFQDSQLAVLRSRLEVNLEQRVSAHKHRLPVMDSITPTSSESMAPALSVGKSVISPGTVREASPQAQQLLSGHSATSGQDQEQPEVSSTVAELISVKSSLPVHEPPSLSDSRHASFPIKGSLSRHLTAWHKISASTFALQVVQHGYVIPLSVLPPAILCLTTVQLSIPSILFRPKFNGF